MDYYSDTIKKRENNFVLETGSRFYNKSVLIGPWFGEIGYEILYWIPFLRWCLAKKIFRKTDVTVVSRGGVRDWYAGIFTDYIEIFDYIDPIDYSAVTAKRVSTHNTQKAIEISESEINFLHDCNIDSSKYTILHPSFMYRFYEGCFRAKGGRAPLEVVRRTARLSRFLCDSGVNSYLPDNYVVVKFYTRSSFPASQSNLDFVTSLIKKLALTDNVVVLDSIDEFDEHKTFPFAALSERVFFPLRKIRPSSNLKVQTEILANADRCYCTYGGFSYLSIMLGIPCLSFKSSDDSLNSVHEFRAIEVSRELETTFYISDLNDKDVTTKLFRSL